MKSRCLLNSCNSTSQFISIMFRCSFFFIILFYFNQIKNFLFLLWVKLCMITGIYLHDPPPFNGPFFFQIHAQHETFYLLSACTALIRNNVCLNFRLLTIPYVSLRSSRSSTYCFWRPTWFQGKVALRIS